MSFEQFKISIKEGAENSVSKPSEFTVITVDRMMMKRSPEREFWIKNHLKHWEQKYHC